ncbi:carbohydrate-binding-like protein [Lactarius hatsudake]|nr:carbohydrate-binding-like protein [Lactarius hatsudake]
MFGWNWDGITAECTNFLGPADYGKDYLWLRSRRAFETSRCLSGADHPSNVFVVGSVPGLGNWDPNNAIPLDPTNYPIWTATAYLPSDTEFEFSFIRKRSDGTIISEPGRPGVDRALASGIVLLFVGRCKKGHTPLFQLQGTS